MTKDDEREVQRKLRILQHAEKIGHVARTCHYFGIGRASFYRWKRVYERDGEDGLVNAKTIPKNPPNRTPPEVAVKVLYLRRKYHLGPERIIWYLVRYHGIKLSDATIYRILKRNGLNRLPRGTRLRKVHTKRYNKQVPGHHIQMDVKFLTFIRKKGEKTRRFQYTAIDDATRVRALKVYKKTYPSQRDRLRRSHHRQVPVPNPRNQNRQWSPVPGQVPLVCLASHSMSHFFVRDWRSSKKRCRQQVISLANLATDVML